MQVAPGQASTHALLARALAATDRYDEATAHAREALRLDPGGETGFDANRLRSDTRQWERSRQDALESDISDDSSVPDDDP